MFLKLGNAEEIYYVIPSQINVIQDNGEFVWICIAGYDGYINHKLGEGQTAEMFVTFVTEICVKQYKALDEQKGKLLSETLTASLDRIK
jgi:hypothetical protein